MTAPLLYYKDVTPAWVSGALQKHWPGIEVRTVDAGPVFGFKKNKFAIAVSYGELPEGAIPPQRFIVKGNFPGENDPSTGSAWAMANELCSIRDIVPLTAAPAMPKSYDIAIDEEASSILMEDLTGQAHFFHAFDTLSLGQAMAFMDTFARMHASVWNSTLFAPGGEMGPGTFAAENRRMVNELYFPTFFAPDNWQKYVELPRGRALPNAFQNLELAKRAWDAMWGLVSQSAMVVIHGDEHLGNLYVAADGTPGVIDWVARPEHWPIGIAYFMLCALDIRDRRQWEKALLCHYLTKLKTYGAADVPAFDEAWFVYRCATFYPVVTWLNNSGVWQPEAINTANAVRAATAALDHDAMALLGV